MNPPKSKSPINPKKLLLLCALNVSALNAFAQSTWLTPGSGTWSVPGNWSGGAPNAVGASARFNTDSAGNDKVITLDTPVTLGSVYIFGAPASATALTFGGSALTFQATAGGALLAVQDQHNVIINSAVSLGSDLQVSLPADGAGAPSTLVLNGDLAGNGHAIAVDVGWQISSVTLGGDISGAGTRVSKSDVGILRFTGNNNTFTGGLALTGGRTETTVSAGAGSGITLGSVAANRNNLGAGNVSVSGNNTVLQIQTSAASQTVNLASGTLTVTNNAQVNILKAATSHTGGAFTVSGGVLDGGAGVSGTLRLSGLDFNKTAGSITNAPNLWLDSGTGATAATVQNIGGSGAINGLGDVTKEGLGTLKVADTVTALSAASLSFRSGTLNFGAGANVTLSGGLTLGVTGTGALTQSVLLGKANQYAGDIEVLPGYALIDSYRNIATVSMGGFDQTIGQLTVGNLAALKLDMGPVGTVNTLTLAKGSNSDVNILNWEGNPDGLANGNAARQDVVLRTGSVNVSDVWFYGYEKGAVNLSGTLKPTTFLTGTFLWLNTDYNDYRNWNSGTNATGMEIPNHAGAIVRNNNNTNIYITGTITLGQWLITNSSNRGAPVAAEDDDDATIIWDSGVAGQAALIQNTGAHLDTGGRLNFVLHSDLRWNVGKTDGITRIISDLISGSGALIIEGNGGYLRNGNSYSGGTIIQSGGRLGLTSGTVATDFALGTGTLTINGGEIFGGHDETTRAIYTVSNPLVIGGNFTASYITFAYGGDVVLNGTRVITVSAAANNNQFTQSVTFSATTNLVGTGALTKGGNYQLQLRSPNNTFSGGLTVTGGELRADIGAGGIVIGALAPGQNYLGSGNINITGGTVRVANNYLAEVRGLITVNYSNYINFYGSGTTLLQSTGTFSGGASHGSIMLEGGQTLVNNGIAWVNTPGIIFASGGTLTGAPVTGLYSLTNHVNGGNALVDTVVSGSFLNINNGQLKLNRDGNWFNTVNLNGGVLRTGTATVNSLGALNLAGNAGIFMEEDSVLTFSAFSATSATQWTAATQLNLANEDGVWNRADALGVTSNYIYITDTTNSGQLDRIAFTGYAPGAMLLNNSGTWYLAPDGATVNEWNGNASAGFSGTTWSAAANWFNGAPDAVGAYAAIREADGKLAGKTISVDGNFTVGTLEIANSAAFTLSGGTLTFDNGGNGAALTLLNSTAPLFNTALQLNDQLRFTNNAAVSVTNLTGKISGTGGIVYSRDSNSNNFGHVLVLNSGNDFSGGFQWIGSMATTPNTATSGNAPRIVFTGNGSYFGTGTLTVGDGTAGRWYQLQPNTTSVTRVVDLGGLVIAGNIFFGQSSANTSAALTLGGSGTVLVTDGTWTLSGNGGNSSNFNSSVGSALTFNMPLAGSGQLQIPAYSRVYFTGGDGSFTGRVSVSGDYSEVTIGSDLALGSGTINLGSAGEFRVVRAANGARTLANTFVLGSYVSWVGNFTLTGSSTLASAMTMGIQNAVTFAADNALAGSGGMSLGSSYGVTVTGGTLVLLGSNSYTGYTSVQSVNLAVGNDHALGTGTLHLSYGSAPTSIATLSSVGGPVTLGNAVVFGSYIRLNGAAGLLTLNPTVAQTSTISSANLAVVVSGGTAAFGSNLTLTGPGALTKSGAGTLRLLNADNDFTGGVQVGQGVLSAQAGGGNITLGKAAAGENYFGSGLVSFVSGNYVRTLELVSTGSVTLAGNLNLIGNSVTYTANVNVTEQSGTVSGNSVKTYLNPDSGMVIAGNEHGYLRVAGDLVKTGAGTVNFAAGNLVSGGAFRMESGALDWNGGNIVTSNLSYTGGALTLGSINSPGTQQLTLGTVTLTVQADANAMLTGATLNVTGNAVIDLNSSGVLTLAGATAGWSGSLTVSDWHGELAGGGDSRLQFVNSVPAELLATTVFADADPEVAYLPGARVTRNYLGYYELVPLGAGAEWTGVDGNYEWATINNWDPNTLPNAAGAVAAFRSADAALNGQTVTLGGNVFLGGLVLDSPAASYTIGGPYVLYFQNLPGAAAYVQMSNVNAVLLDTEIVLPGNLEIQHHGSGALVFDRNISGIGGITKDGPGTVLFNAGNTYLGGFTLRDGTVVIGHPDALAGGQLIFAGGTLSTGGAARTLSNNHTLSGTTFFSGTVTLAGNGLVTGSAGVITNDTLTLSGPLSGNGQLTKSGPGTLLLTGSNTSTGGFVLAEGITGINNSAALGTGPLTLGAPASPPATLRLDANALNLANNITASGGTIDTQANNATLSGKIAGSGGLTKAGTGTLTVTQSNTYTGTTNISEGVIVATNADALGQSPVSLTSPASPTSLVLAFNNATFDNSVSGSGNLTVSGTGIRIDGATNTLTGTWHVNGSALINAAADLGASAKVNLTGTLTTDGNANLTFSNTLYGAGVINFTGSGTHGFAAATGTNYTGTARANGGVFDWNPGASTALKKATLETVSGKTLVNSGTQSAAKLIMNGGTTQFTGTAYVTDYTISGSSNILFDQTKLNSKPLLQQDEQGNETLVVSVNNWTGNLSDLHLVNPSGSVLGTTSTLAVGTGTEALGVYSNTLGKTGNTLTLGYALQELKLQSGKTLTLSGDTTGAGAELHALISGVGNLTIAATNAITLNTAETFTGTLTVSTGTLLAGVSDLVISSTRLIVNSAFALNGFNQAVNNLSGSGTTLLGSNTLTLNTTTSSTYAGSISGAGVVVKTGAATQTLSGSSNHSGGTRLTSGTLRLTNASALGSGTAAVAATLVTEFTGTLSNNLSGSGTVRAVSGANVTLGGNNASLTGLLDILAGGKVTASAAANVGTARLAVGGTFIADNSAAWNLTNTLSGAGVLLKQNTANLQITQANTAFTGTALITAGTLTLGHLQGVGSAAIADNSVLQLSGLSGTLANNISGAGNVDVNASAVTLSGNNTLSGTWNIAATSNLKTINANSLGSGKVNVSGTLTLGGIDNWLLNIDNLLSGAGALVKEGTNTVTVSHSNSYSGGSVITSGELNLANLSGLGTGNINNSAALRLSANNGLFANNVSGSGTAIVSGSGINITGTNTVATWRVTGSGTVSGTANLGAGALFLDGGVLNFTPANNASVTLGNALTGNGSLVVTLGSNTSQWAFAPTSGATFTGTLTMRQGEYKFSTADQTGAGALKNATLMLSQVDASNVGTANLDQNYTIGSLNMAGGILQTTITAGNTASGTLTVTDLLSAAGGGKLQANGLDLTGLTGTVGAGQNFFADSGSAQRYQIEVVKATGTAQGTQLTLVDTNGAVIGSGADVTRKVADGSGTAHYNYAATLGARTDGEQGLFIGYGLTELQANSGTQILLSNGVTTAVLDAKLTGGGGFRIEGGAAVASLGNAASSYTGTTSVVSGTVRLTANNGFGWSSLLDLAAATRVDLNDVTQNVGGLTVAANASVRVGADGSLAVNNLLGDGHAVNAGLLDADGGRLGVSGNLTNSGTVLGGAANPAALTVGGTLTNSGLMNLANRSLAVNGLLANSGTLTVGQLAAATQVVNQGLLSGAGAGEDTIGGNLTNSGTVDLAARALAVGGAYTGSAGSALTVASGSIGGAATLSANATVSAGTLTVTGALINSGSINTSQLTAQAAYTGSAGSVLNLNGGAATIIGPLTVTAGGKIMLGANGSLTASGGGALAGDGALTGSGTLRVTGNNQLLTVSGSNAVALLVTIDATDTLELRHRAALGTSGTVTTSGTLRLAGVSGAFALDLAGAGNISATDAANVILTGSNTFSGTWQIAAGSGLKAVSANSLGTGQVNVSGTLTLGGIDYWLLNIDNLLSGAGALVKEDNNTVTVSHSNSYSGGSVITSGELNLANLNGLGTGNVANSAALRLSANNGVFTNHLSGTGVTILSGSGVTVSGSNSLFTGTWHVTGSGTMTAQQNLGAVGVTAVNLSGDLALILGAVDYDFNQPLSGSGTLTVSNSGALNFTGNTGGAFTGNVVLRDNQFALDGNNTAALAHATLTVGEGNHTVVAGGTQAIGNLTLNSGTLGFTLAASGTAAEGLVDTGTLTVSAAAVVVVNTGSFNGALPLLRQDERRDLQLVAATALGAGSVTQITGANLLDQDGQQLTDATHKDIVQQGVITAGGTYDFAAMVSGSGLYLGYELTALELLAGQTTVLDHDLANAVLAGADELHARVSGSGNLQISASHAITLNNGANNYTGATLVTGGTLVVGHSGALGDTALLELAADTTVDLNGNSQTVGAFNGSAGSTLNLNGGALTISGSGGDSVSLGRLTGSGTLGVADASFSVSGSNSIGGLVDIAAAAVVMLDDAGGLGASEIALGGSLVLSATVSGELVNSLSGSGALVQQGGETVTIAQANDGFNGTVRVQGGALALEHVAAVGSAEVTIEQGGVLAYRNVSGTLQNNIGGDGELVILSASLTVTDERAVDVALVSLAAGSVTLDTTNSFGRNITVDADSQILLARDGAQLGNVANHGLLEFGDAGGGFKTAQVGDLSGGGVIVLNVDIAAQQGDLLQTGAVSGTHGIVFNRLDGPGGVTGKEKILLIETAGGGAFVSGTLQDGMFQYTVLDGAGNPNLDGNANNWWLMGNGLSIDGRVILSVAGASSLGWFAQQDSLLQRLGGLRLDYEQLDGRSNLAKHGAGDVWARGYGQQVNAGGGASGAAFKDTLWGTDIGADKLWQLNSGNVLYTGVFGGYGQSELEFRHVSANAESNSYQGGVYATWLHERGWYADWVAKAAYLDNSFETFDLSGQNRGEYNNWAAGTSVEVGRKIQLPGRWFIEPQAQLSYLHVFGADYSTRGVSDLAVNQADADILQGRLGALFGQTIRLNNQGLLQPYAKAMLVGQTSRGGTVTASSGGAIQGADGRWRPNYDGLRAQFGAGIIWQLDDHNQLHLDYQAEFGDQLDQPWGLTAGYRYQF